MLAHAQSFNRPPAAAYYCMGAYSLNHTDGFSFTCNPAALAQLKAPVAGMAGSRRYLLQDLSEYAAVTAVTTHSGNFGLKINYAGSAEYNETGIGLGYGRKLGSKADAGILIGYDLVKLPSGYGSASLLQAEAGITFHITGQLHSGIHFSKPAGKFGKDKTEDALPVFTIGFGYEPSAGFLFSAEMEKTVSKPVNINAGIQYDPVSRIHIRAGISSATSSYLLGAGFDLSMLRIHLFSVYHPQLGITPGLLLLYQFKKNRK